MPDLIIKEQHLNEQLKNKISISLGWKEFVDDTTQELIGDEYPQIANPITRDLFLSQAIVQEIMFTIIKRGREMMINKAKEQIDKINNGDFDNLII